MLRTIVIATLLPALLGAQSELRPGARVKIEAPGVVAGALEGTVLTRTRDTLTIGSENLAPLAIPMASIRDLSISHGSSRAAGAERGALWGVGVGAVLGLGVMGSATSCDTINGQTTCGADTASEKVGVVTWIGVSCGIWGAIIGAIAGRETWDHFDVPSVSVTTDHGRPALALSLHF